MQRIAALSFALLLGASLVACGGKSKPMTAAAPANTGTEETEAPAADAPGGGAGDPAQADGAAQSKGMPAPDADDPCSGDE